MNKVLLQTTQLKKSFEHFKEILRGRKYKKDWSKH